MDEVAGRRGVVVRPDRARFLPIRRQLMPFVEQADAPALWCQRQARDLWPELGSQFRSGRTSTSTRRDWSLSAKSCLMVRSPALAFFCRNSATRVMRRSAIHRL